MTACDARRPRVVVAGQIPPPIGGQTIHIAEKLAMLREDSRLDVALWPFRFTPDLAASRRFSAGKIVALVAAWLHLLRIRLRGPIDLLFYPAGGPHTAPLVRDLLLLPPALLCSRVVALQFHAAGAADRFAARSGWLYHAVARLYRRVPHAIVMTEFNRSDPAWFGMKSIHVIPGSIVDRADPSLRPRAAGNGLRILSVGHLCPDKGTDFLVDAFRRLAGTDPHVRLDLVGPPLPPFDGRQVREWLEAPPGPERITWHGLLTGPDLNRVFASADLFVFASVAPYESFGQVIVQAMMWGLPIVLSDWRANREVAGPGMDGVLFSVTDPSRRADRLAEALRQAAAQRRANPKWGAANRATFEKRYRRTSGRNGYTAFAASILGRRQSPE